MSSPGFVAAVKLRSMFAALMAGSLAACTPAPAPVTPADLASARPLDTLPAEATLTLVRQDLLATAVDRFGAAALTEARSAPTHPIVKRFVGMAPPPPPGADIGWRPTPAAALLVRRSEGWVVATATGWRPANAQAAFDLDKITADPSFWSEPAITPPCPDFGAGLLLLKVPRKGETIRNSKCMSDASRLIEAALRA